MREIGVAWMKALMPAARPPPARPPTCRARRGGTGVRLP